MANTTWCLNFRTTISVDYESNTPSLSEIWSVTNPLDTKSPNYCVEITNTSTEVSSYTLVTNYADCYTCLEDNYGVIQVYNCVDERDVRTIPISEFGILPNGKETYFLTLSGNGQVTESCWVIDRRTQYTEQIYLENLKSFSYIVSTNPITAYTSCLECYGSNGYPFLVQRCTDGIFDCVNLIDGLSLVGATISYSDGAGNVYCGSVNGINPEDCPPGTSAFTYISNFGFDKNACDSCLSVGNQKLLLQNCLDPGITQVVWASSLFGLNETSHLSINEGCFTISGVTEDPVTINSYLNYDPQTGCEPCIECNGYSIIWESCDVPEITGVSTSYQYVAVNGYFYHPYYGCCVVTNVSNDITLGTDILLGFLEFTNCNDCQTSEISQILWEATGCTSGDTNTYLISVPVGANVGEVYQTYWGNNPYICMVLTQQLVEPSPGYVYYFSQTLIQDCSECSRIGLSAINCGTSNFSTSISITQEDYIRLIGYTGGLNYYVITNGEICYFIPNYCPTQPTGQTINNLEFLLGCFDCELPPPPVSAGTEYFVCQICEGESGYTATQITVPHPVWTRPNGQQVTLLDAVQLGGMFGLNS